MLHTINRGVVDYMSFIGNKDFYLEVVKGNIPGHSVVHKYGKNPQIPNSAAFEAIWNGGGPYTGFDATSAETLEVFSGAAADAGTVLSSGTATGGTLTTLVDSGATFVSDGVASGDVCINDTGLSHGIVESLTETEITVLQFRDDTIPVSTDAYRIVTQASTGSPVCRLDFLLDSNYDETSEYIVLNGVTGVNTVGTYLRQSRGETIGGDNAGDITCRQNVTVANIMMVMPAGFNTTMIAAYTIPRGKHGFILDWFGALAGKVNANLESRFRRRERGDAFQVLEEISSIGGGTSYTPRRYVAPKNSLPAMSDIHVEASSDTNSTVVVAGFELLLIDDGI
jgi:hypothetical protein